VDLRADTNRNGVLDWDLSSEDENEDTWDSTHGAVFLANIDDDGTRCSRSGSDENLAACNDASDEEVNGPDDALDLAPLGIAPMPGLSAEAEGRLTVEPPQAEALVRLFRRNGTSFAPVATATDLLTSEELRAGVALALEGKDIVRDSEVWDGYITLTLTVTEGSTEVGRDSVTLRVAPVVTPSHLDRPETVYVANDDTDGPSVLFRQGLREGVQKAGLPAPVEFNQWGDRWTQDVFEPAYMTMPSSQGVQAMHVNYRSANYTFDGGSRPRLRRASRIVFTELRGKDVAGVVQYDPRHPDDMDTLNSFGNLETVPPYTNQGQAYPLGRIIRGSSSKFYPDKAFQKMLDSQGVQPSILVDTSWLLVAHIDEVISFLPSTQSPRGWVLAAADPRRAKALLDEMSRNGQGRLKVFAGRKFVDDYGNESEASRTIDDVLDDDALMAANQLAAVKVDAIVQRLQSDVGLGASDVVSVPFLLGPIDGHVTAYQPGVVNGISLGSGHFVAPKPFGPMVGGKDVFEKEVEDNFRRHGVSIHWVDDWASYHLLEGEAHCGTNVRRAIPTNNFFFTSGR
jgi:protein-arginine deiminase